MINKFRNKYRQESARLQTWNYGWDAAYFITICTKDRGFYFGDIVDGEMQLSPVGMIANDLWYEIKNHAKNIELGEFVVMPNHIHGIIVLDGNDPVNPVDPVGTRHALSLPRSPQPSQPSSDQSPQPKKQLANNDIKTREKIPFHLLLVHTNRRLQNTVTGGIWFSPGKPDSTTTSSATGNHLNEFLNTL